MEAATGGVTPFRSILDKPLNQLTEDDISQLTREDCRKYLKEKGMRRPSWNKSQAIQQVISLKALLESTDDSGAGVFRRILVSKSVPLGTVNGANKDAGGGNDSSRANCPPAESMDDANAVDLGSPEGSEVSLKQMTIFYSGKVNVYEGVSPDKARVIMHLAASRNQLSLDGHAPRATLLSSPSLCSQISDDDMTRFPERCADQLTNRRDKWNASADLDVESPACRKVSLQRYLEKKKERGKFKSKKSCGFPSPGIEVCWNPVNQITGGHTIKSATNFPTQSKEPVNVAFSVDLNSGP